MPDSTALAQALLLNQRRRISPEESQRKYGEAIMQQGAQTTPVHSPLEALARAIQGGVGGFFAGQADRAETANDTASNDFLTRAAGAGSQGDLDAILKTAPKSNNDVIAPLLATMIANKQQQWQLGAKADAFGVGYGQAPGGAAPQTAGAGGGPGQAIGNFESGGNYNAVGPVANAQGDRAHGKYQVMGANVGPWTKEVLGQEMTPEQFLANPQAQEAVFKAKFGQYRQQYGNDQDAASMWFSGKPMAQAGNAKDVNGVSVPQYVAGTVGAAPGQPPQPAQPQGAPPVQMAQASGQPPQGSADASGTPQPASGTPSMASPPAVPNVPRPQPTPQQITKYQTLMRQGLTEAQARQGLDAELDRDWGVRREQAKMAFDQQSHSFQANQKQQLDQPQENLTNEAKLRNEFQGLQSVKDYRKAAATFKDAVEASKGNSKASDLNMVYAFATMMDPGSVVREGEMGMVNATSSASDRIKGLVAGLQGGAALSPETRQALIAEMAHRYTAYKGVHDQIADQFGQIAQRSGMDSRNIIAPLPPVAYERAPTGPPKVGDVMQGHRFKGGDPGNPASWEKVQ